MITIIVGRERLEFDTIRDFENSFEKRNRSSLLDIYDDSNSTITLQNRDPEIYRYIFDYMRNNHVYLPATVDKHNAAETK